MSNDSAMGWTEVLGEAGTLPETPRSSGDTVFALGQEWKVSSVEMRVKAQFEQWVRKSAKRCIAEVEMEDGPEESSKMRSAYMADYASGCYSWDGRHCRTARSDLAGIRYLFFLLFKRCQPNITETIVNQILRETDCSYALRWALGNSPDSPVKTTESTNQEKSNGKTE